MVSRISWERAGSAIGHAGEVSGQRVFDRGDMISGLNVLTCSLLLCHDVAKKECVKVLPPNGV